MQCKKKSRATTMGSTDNKEFRSRTHMTTGYYKLCCHFTAATVCKAFLFNFSRASHTFSLSLFAAAWGDILICLCNLRKESQMLIAKMT